MNGILWPYYDDDPSGHSAGAHRRAGFFSAGGVCVRRRMRSPAACFPSSCYPASRASVRHPKLIALGRFVRDAFVSGWLLMEHWSLFMRSWVLAGICALGLWGRIFFCLVGIGRHGAVDPF